MELASFKEVLLKKATGNKNLSILIKYIGEDFLAETIVEALEKMKSGTKASGPVTNFGKHIDETGIAQLRDAMGHHLSHYKAALKAHHAAPENSPEKAHFRQVADKHLENMLPLMDLTKRAAHHSEGKLGISYPSLSPWETNYTTLERNKTGKTYARVPKLLRLRPSKREDSVVPDYRYLEMPPNPGHPEVATLPHAGGYPWEEVQVGSPQNIDAKKAYLHTEDIPDKKDYVPHAFDKHPIRKLQDSPEDFISDETRQQHAKDLSDWYDSDHLNKWLDEQEAKETADKEGFEKRGQTKGSHFYEGIPLLPHRSHVNNYPKVKTFAEHQAETPKDSPIKAQSTAPTVRKPEMEEIYQSTARDPRARAQLVNMSPAFADYVKQKEGK